MVFAIAAQFFKLLLLSAGIYSTFYLIKKLINHFKKNKNKH